MKTQYYCKKCGTELVARLLPNEEKTWRSSMWSIYGYERVGDAYDLATGKKLYLVKMECPRKEISGMLRQHEESHYAMFPQDNITKEQAEEMFDIK